MSLRRAALLATLLALSQSPAFAQARSQRAAPAAEIDGDPEVGSTEATNDAMPIDWPLFVPPTDGSFSTWGETPPELGLVKRVFELSFPEECSWALGRTIDGIEDPDVYDVAYREDYDEAGAPDRVAKLYRFFCDAGAYNVQHVYMLWESDAGLRSVLFAAPRLDIKYAGDDYDGALESIAIDGFDANPTLVNSWYDPTTRSIFADSYWRGIGDASSHAAYTFKSGSFGLDRYDVDPTYDGEINLFRIYDGSNRQPLELVPVAMDDLPMNPERTEDE